MFDYVDYSRYAVFGMVKLGREEEGVESAGAKKAQGQRYPLSKLVYHRKNKGKINQLAGKIR